MLSMDRKYIQAFIEKYKSLTCLWKVKCEEYKNKCMRITAYNELLAVTREYFPEADIDFVKKKINNLRTAFRKELRKCHMAQMSGDVYTPSLWYFDMLHFTGDQETDPLEEDYNEYNCNVSITPVIPNELSPPSHDSLEQVILKLPERSRKRPLEDSEPYMYTVHHSRSRREDNDNNTPTDTAQGAVNYNNRDLCEAFGGYVAAKLRCMNKHQRLFAENVINQALFHGSIGELSAASAVSNPATLYTHVSANQPSQSIGHVRNENSIKTEVIN